MYFLLVMREVVVSLFIVWSIIYMSLFNSRNKHEHIVPKAPARKDNRLAPIGHNSKAYVAEDDPPFTIVKTKTTTALVPTETKQPTFLFGGLTKGIKDYTEKKYMVKEHLKKRAQELFPYTYDEMEFVPTYGTYVIPNSKPIELSEYSNTVKTDGIIRCDHVDNMILYSYISVMLVELKNKIRLDDDLVFVNAAYPLNKIFKYSHRVEYLYEYTIEKILRALLIEKLCAWYSASHKEAWEKSGVKVAFNYHASSTKIHFLSRILAECRGVDTLTGKPRRLKEIALINACIKAIRMYEEDKESKLRKAASQIK